MRRAGVAFAGDLVIGLREGLDEDVRQRAGWGLAQAAIELAVQFPVAHGLATRAALEARGEIARIEAADEVDERGEHRAQHGVVVLARAGERLPQPRHGVEAPAVVRAQQFLDELLDAVTLERG